MINTTQPSYLTAQPYQPVKNYSNFILTENFPFLHSQSETESVNFPNKILINHVVCKTLMDTNLDDILILKADEKL